MFMTAVVISEAGKISKAVGQAIFSQPLRLQVNCTRSLMMLRANFIVRLLLCPGANTTLRVRGASGPLRNTPLHSASVSP